MDNENKAVSKILLVGSRRTCDAAARLPFSSSELISFPVIDTRVLENISFEKQCYEWLILTSPAAAIHFSKLENKPQFSKMAVVGPSTKKTAEEKKMSVDFVPEQYNSSDFSHAFLSKYPSAGPALFPCSEKADCTIENEFRDAGVSLERVNLYTPAEVELNVLPEFDSIAFFSSSSVEIFHNTFGKIEGKKMAAIGKKAAKTVRELFGIEPSIPEKSTARDTIQTLL